MRKTVFSILIFLGNLFPLFSQEASYKRPLETPEGSGFYRIPLGPEVVKDAKANLSDIRIKGSKGRETPYILKKEEPRTFGKRFVRYEILEKDHKKGCCTELIVHNPQKKEIRNISLIIKNSDVSKSLSLLGSNDRKDWFTVKEQHRIHSIKNEEKTSEIKILDFPLSDYEFFKIRIDDSTSAPLNIKMAGYSKMVEKKSRYFKIPNPKVEQRDTLKKSIISLQFPSPDYLIERLELSLSGPSYFYRKGKVKVRKDGNGPYVVERFELTSYGDHSVEMRPVRSKGLQIQIANEDNPPLKMEKVKAYQLKRWLIAYLEGGKDYSLLYGDKKANKPEYDLSHFRDSIPDSPPLLDVKKIEKIEKDQKEGSAFFTSRFWIWSGAILVGILLAALSFNMIREVGNRKKDGS